MCLDEFKRFMELICFPDKNCFFIISKLITSNINDKSICEIGSLISSVRDSVFRTFYTISFQIRY